MNVDMDEQMKKISFLLIAMKVRKPLRLYCGNCLMVR